MAKNNRRTKKDKIRASQRRKQKSASSRKSNTLSYKGIAKTKPIKSSKITQDEILVVPAKYIKQDILKTIILSTVLISIIISLSFYL